MLPFLIHLLYCVTVHVNPKLLLSGLCQVPPWGPLPDFTCQQFPSENILVVLMLHQKVVAHEPLVVDLMTMIHWRAKDGSGRQLMARQTKRQGEGGDHLKVNERFLLQQLHCFSKHIHTDIS